MPVYVDHLPYQNVCTARNAQPGLAVGGRRVALAGGHLHRPREFHPIARVSLTDPATKVLRAGHPDVPVVLDTGFTGTLCLTREQAVGWAGMSPSELDRYRAGRSRDRGYTIHQMRVWFWPNRPHTWELTGRPADPLPVETVPVCQPGSPFARDLPRFGRQAIHDHQLRLVVDPHRGTIPLRRQRRFLWFRF